MRVALVAGLLALGVVFLAMWAACLEGCGGGLSADDQANISNAAKLAGMGYAHQDAGTAGAALDRGAYCAAAAVLRNQKLPAVDAGFNCGP